MKHNIQGVVLAGGESKRFGSPKAFAVRNGMYFYQYSIKAIETFVSSVLVVTNSALTHLFSQDHLNMSVVNDHKNYRGQGPLAGIYTAMNTVQADWYMVIPIDVPFAEKWVFSLLHEHINDKSDAVVPVVTGKKEPLLAIYSYSLKQSIKEQLDLGKRSVYNLLNKSQVTYVPIENQNPFLNINMKKDYEQYIQVTEKD